MCSPSIGHCICSISYFGYPLRNFELNFIAFLFAYIFTRFYLTAVIILSEWCYCLHFVDEEVGSQMNLWTHQRDPATSCHRPTENRNFKKVEK